MAQSRWGPRIEGGGGPLPPVVAWSEEDACVTVLDQTLLPREERVLHLRAVAEVAEAIASLRVRGAPAIGVAAALGVVLGARRRLEAGRTGREEWEQEFREDLEQLRSCRPTAVNLGWALERMARSFRSASTGGPAAQVEALLREAEAIEREDREMCERIGEAGLKVLPEEGCAILTHCNAGALATAGIGTALAPIYRAHREGIPVHVLADETRPLLQGARLTAWELARAGIEVTVIADSAAAAAMAQGKVNLVLVGADRVAANGDTANKIGTYGLAVLAQHHGIPFYVALPRSTFDPAAPQGTAIPIEERSGEEIQGYGGLRWTAEGARVWNPAFDVTPAHLVTAFITDGGILRPPYRVSIARLLEATSSPPAPGPERSAE